MTSYVALLRGINVGGNKMVAMADLRSLLSRLDFENPESLGQSGNLIFKGPHQKSSALEQLLETEAAKALKVQFDCLVRNIAEWKAVVDGNPFIKEAKADPSHTVAMCLKGKLKAESVERLRAKIVGPERIEAAGSTLYLVYPDGMGRSKLTHGLIEKTLGLSGTARNWNTVLKIAAKLEKAKG